MWGARHRVPGSDLSHLGLLRELAQCMIPLLPWTMPLASGPRTAQAARLLTRRILTFALQRRNDLRRRYAAMPQLIDGAIARWRKPGGAARSNGLIMRSSNAAKWHRVALPPGRGATAQDGPPDDDQFQVRKAAAFSRGPWPESSYWAMPCAPTSQSEATLQGAVGEIMTFIIRV
jgi:hypothetical protein